MSFLKQQHCNDLLFVGLYSWDLYSSSLGGLLIAAPKPECGASFSFYGKREHIPYLINAKRFDFTPTDKGLEFISGLYTWIVADDTGTFHNFGVKYS